MTHDLVLLRGLPGSGKTTLAKVLAGTEWPVFSIDDYFTDAETGDYEFVFDRNHLAYKQCENSARNAMAAGMHRIFVDNTFTLEWELEPYFKLASEFNYRVFTLTVENRHHGKNVHKIADEQIAKMAEKYRVVLY